MHWYPVSHIPASNWEPNFGLFKPHQHFPWIALSTAGFWCLCLAIYYFYEGMGSSALWMLPAPGSAVSQKHLKSCKAQDLLHIHFSPLPFSLSFLFAGQNTGTPLFACPGPGQVAFNSWWGLLLLEKENQGCCVSFEEQDDAPVPSLCRGVLWVTWQVTPKMQLGMRNWGTRSWCC